MTAEDTNIPQPANNNPLEDGGELLQAIEWQLQAPEVTEQVEETKWGIKKWISKYFLKLDPEREVARLIMMREVANDNTEKPVTIPKIPLAANDNIPQAISNDTPKKAA